jgi:hypothetical protein
MQMMNLSPDHLHEMRQRFLGHMEGFKNFKDCGETYLAQERPYKDELATLFRKEVKPLFESFAGDSSSANKRDAKNALFSLYDLLANRQLKQGWGRPQNLSIGAPQYKKPAPHDHLVNLSGADALVQQDL